MLFSSPSCVYFVDFFCVVVGVASQVEYLRAVITHWDLQTKHLESVEEAVLSAVGDADAEARAGGRRCYVALRARWPDVGKRVFARMEPAAQRQCSSDAAALVAANTRSGGGAHVRPASASASSAAAPKPSLVSVSSSARAATLTKSSASVLATTTHALASMSVSRSMDGPFSFSSTATATLGAPHAHKTATSVAAAPLPSPSPSPSSSSRHVASHREEETGGGGGGYERHAATRLTACFARFTSPSSSKSWEEKCAALHAVKEALDNTHATTFSASVSSVEVSRKVRRRHKTQRNRKKKNH